MLQHYEICISDCTKSLEINPKNNTKALLRRMNAYEKIEKYEQSIEDGKLLLAQQGSSSEDGILQAIKRCEQGISIRNDKLKDEMMGKLKDLGNGLLGKFGLSLDNFKTTKDPNTGNYSVAFQK